MKTGEAELISLRECLAIILSKWKLLLGFSSSAMMVAALFVWSMPSTFEIRVKLLSLAASMETENVPANEREIFPNYLMSTMSLGTLANLASAKDLMAQVITELNLQSEQGELWTVSKLANSMNVTIESGIGVKRVNLPILSVKFQGNDPHRLKQIADKWTELFVKRNANLFVTESARSYEFLYKQYMDTERKLNAKKDLRYKFVSVNPLETLKSRQSVLMGRYTDFSERFYNKRALLIAATSRLASTQKVLLEEPSSLTLQRGIPSEAVWALLGQKMDTLRAGAIPDLIIREQLQSMLYLTLKSQIAMSKIEVDTLEAEVAFLEKQTEAHRNEIDTLGSKLSKIELGLAQFNREVDDLERSLKLLQGKLLPAQLAKEQQEGFIRVVEAPIEPRVPVGPHRLRFIVGSFMLSVISGAVLVVGIELIRKANQFALKYL